jgi:hypothetical protein
MNINQTPYRKIDALSASEIKLFNKDRMTFYYQKVLGEKRKEKSSESLTLGTLIDFVLSDCKGSWQEFERRFDEKFVLLSVKKGSGQLFLLADLIYEYTLRDMDEEGNITSSFSVRFEEAFDQLQKQDKFKGKKVDWALEQFKDSEAETYFSENLKATDKLAIDTWMLDKAKFIIDTVLVDDNVKHLFEETENVENFGKHVIEWEYKGLKAKSELDNLTINHTTKEIIITEIKSTWSSEEEGFARTYLKLRYDLAAAFYCKAVQYIFNENLMGYTIKFQFLVVDTSPQGLRPLIYKVSDLDLNNAEFGFKTKSGYYYKGLDELVEEILWCQETQNWRISKEAYENNGILNLNINYE